MESIPSLVFILKKGKKHARPKCALDINRAHFGIYLKLSSKLSKGQQRTSSDHSLAVKQAKLVPEVNSESPFVFTK